MGAINSLPSGEGSPTGSITGEVTPNKSKVMGEIGLTSYEKKNNRVTLYVDLECKVINNKKVICGKYRKDVEYDKQQPPDEEYTNINSFSKMVAQKIKDLAGELE